MQDIAQKIENLPSCKVVFTDFFDTLVHRKVHPNFCIKLWAKHMIRELGISISIDQLFSIRFAALSFLAKEQGINTLEVNYRHLVKEVYNRLVNNNILQNTDYTIFEKIFENADYISEVSTQFKNDKLINSLDILKKKGYKIYLVTDFFLSKSLIHRIVNFHEIQSLFDDLFVSCELSKSKEKGTIYPYILSKVNLVAEEVIMIGDNLNSDVINAGIHGIKSIHTKHKSHHFRNKKNLFGKDSKQFKKACKSIERECRKSNYPFSEYILHYYFFIERLYIKASQDGVRNLFFLAREGLYLRKLFDLYQELNLFDNITKINTHYLRASRQSAQLVNLKPLSEEKFDFIEENYGKMSPIQFMEWLQFSSNTTKIIEKELNINLFEVHENFFKSDSLKKLRANSTFIELYELNRLKQKESFSEYMLNFNTQIDKEGIALVDVGWGGTMQEGIYNFYDEKIPVTGYYLGLKEIYNIKPKTKRYGLNFSLYPNRNYSYEILKANGQLYEQLLAAPHGSTLGYSDSNGKVNPIEYHEENEKHIFEHYIKDIQNYMLSVFDKLFNKLRTVNYTQEQAQEYITDMAMRNGIFSNKKKIKFVYNISQGFYQNIGGNQVGLTYSPKQLRSRKRALLKLFILSPEKVFRFIVKTKPYLYGKGLYWMSLPINLIYYYMKFNIWLKKKIFPKKLLN